MKYLKKLATGFKKKVVEFILDEYGGNLSEYIMGIVIGVIIFFVIIAIVLGVFTWAGDSFNDLFNWTGAGG